MRKFWLGVLVAAGLLGLAGCSANEAGTGKAADKKEIRIGATAGPYSDQIRHSIAGLLEKEGYTVKITEFSDYIQPNSGLNEGSLDVNVYQNLLYLENFNEEHKMDLVNTIMVPTVPIGAYSEKYGSAEEVEKGAKVSLPNDPVNLARALIMMEEQGWIKLNPKVDAGKASINDVAENLFDLEFIPLEAAQLPRSMEDADVAFINGNFAIASGLKLEESLFLENTPDHYMIQIVVKRGNENEPYVKALEAAYKSEEFLQYTNDHLQGFVRPDYMK